MKAGRAPKRPPRFFCVATGFLSYRQAPTVVGSTSLGSSLCGN